MLRLSGKMASSNLTSEAVFTQRAVELGLSAQEITIMRLKGWCSYARFAFACNYTPGQPDETPFLRLAGAITNKAIDEIPEDRMPLIRMLFFEAYTLAAADLRSRVERRDDDAPRKLAGPERASRHVEQVSRLTGLELTGELEISHALADLVVQMAEESQLRYIRWEQCTKRDQELMEVKLDPMWKPDGRGVVRESLVQREIQADLGTDLLLTYALQRRSLAFDQCKLVTYDRFERWSQIMISSYLRQPPAGHQRVTLDQLHTADLELFKALMRKTRTGIRMQSSGVFPLEVALEESIQAAEIRLFLQPLPGSARSAESGSKRKAEESSETDKLRRTVENLQGRLKNLGKGKERNREDRRSGDDDARGSKDKGKAKAKGNGRERNAFRMPRELVGQDAADSQRRPICFDFNLQGCNKAEPGGRCKSGMHLCSRPGCHQAHSQKDHSA